MSIRVRQLSGLLFIYTTGSVHRFKWSNRNRTEPARFYGLKNRFNRFSFSVRFSRLIFYRFSRFFSVNRFFWTPLILSNILHVSHNKKPLLSIQKFLLENNVFFKFHPFMLYVKDLITKEVVLSGRSRGGLYIMYESSATLLPQAFLFACLSTCIDIWHWHCWLGHLNLRILSVLVSNKKNIMYIKTISF
jgi:hypothetical protein